MARRTEDVVYGRTGQTLLLRVPQGRPSAATFEVFAESVGDDGTAEFSGTATVDTVNTTLSAAAGPAQADPRRVELASTTGIIAGRKYLLSEGQVAEWVEPIEVAGAYVRLRDRLLHNFTTSATFVSTYVSADVDDVWVADRANLSDLSGPNPDYRVRWVATVGGVEREVYSFFDLVRAPFEHAVSIGDVALRFPGVAEMLHASDRTDQARALIDSAWRMVRLELAASGLNDTAIMEHEALDEAVTYAARLVLAEGGTHPRSMDAAGFAEIARATYERFMEKHFLVLLRPRVAVGSDSAAVTKTAQPFWVK
jgi:hypothetical protein